MNAKIGLVLVAGGELVGLDEGLKIRALARGQYDYVEAEEIIRLLPTLPSVWSMFREGLCCIVESDSFTMLAGVRRLLHKDGKWELSETCSAVPLTRIGPCIARF